MKLLTAVLFFVVVGQVQAAGRTCYGRNESCSLRRNLICAEVEKLDDYTYRLNNLEHITGCVANGVYKYKSKNRICKNILAKFGEKRKVKFASGSAIRGEWETGYGFKSVGQIDCEIKE